MNIGSALKICRAAKSLSLREVAAQSQLSVSYLSLIEAGKRDPSMKIVQAIAQAMQVPTPIVMFLAADANELVGIERSEIERFSDLALRVIRTQ
jgi:transcriptional regulator with XRE-family HTH domain